MRVRSAMFASLAAVVILCLPLRAKAQRIVPYPSGADETGPPPQSSVGLLLETGLANQTSFFRESLFAPAADRLLIQVGPSGFGEVVVGKASAYVLVPYVVNLGLLPTDPRFPDLYSFEWDHGLADVRGGTAFDLLRERDNSPLNLNASLDFVAPTGESRFERESLLPLGNGFWNLAVSGGLSRRLSPRTLVFASGSHVERRKRTFRDSRLSIAPLTLIPEDIDLARGGIGVVLEHGSLLSFQFERMWLGAVLDGSQRLIEPSDVVTRIGANLAVNRGRGLNGSIFGGVELSGGDTRTVLTMAVPLFRIIGLDF